MKDNFDELNKALNTASDIVKSEPKEMKIVKSLKSEDKDIQKDYEYTRGNLYSLIEKRTRSNQWNHGSSRGRC